MSDRISISSLKFLCRPLPLYASDGSKTALIRQVRKRRKEAKKAAREEEEAMKEQKKKGALVPNYNCSILVIVRRFCISY